MGVEGSLPHTPSHSLTLPGVCDATPGLLLALTPGLPLGLIPRLLLGLTPGLPLGPQPYNPFAFGPRPKARVATHEVAVTNLR